MKHKSIMKRTFSWIISILMIFVNLVTVPAYAEDSLSNSVFMRVDSLDDGEYLIVSTDSGSGYALKNPGGSSSGASMGSASVTIEQGDVDGDGEEDQYINTEDSTIIWTVSTVNGHIKISNSGDYLEGKSGKVNIYSTEQYADRGWTYEGSQLKHTGGQNTYVVYYDNGFTSTYNSSSDKVYLYKKTEVIAGDAEVTGVTIDKDSLSIAEGKTAQLKATVSPSNAANKNVSWASSNEEVATVDDTGKVTGVSEGTATVTVTTEDGGFAASCEVTVTEHQAEPESAYMRVDSLDDGEYLIVSTDSGSGYALKNPGGSSSGASMGSASVTIEQGDVDGDGEEDQYINTEDSTIIWTVSTVNGHIKISNSGDYLEGKSGKVNIYSTEQYADRGWTYEGSQLKHTGGQNTYVVYYDNGFTSTYNSSSDKVYLYKKTEVIAGDAEVTGVTIDKDSLSIAEGKTAQLKATVSPSNAANKNVSWASSNEEVATVDDTGKVTGVSEGTATVTVTTEDGGFAASCEVTVTEHQAEPESAYMRVDSLDDGEYLIVSTDSGSGYALKNPGGSSSGASMGSASVTIEQGDVDGDGTEDSYISTEDSTIIWTVSTVNGHIKISNSGDYLEGKSGKVNIYSTEQYADRGWTYEGSQLKHTGGQNTYVVYYDNGFTSTYNSSSDKVYLFKKTEVVSGDAPVEGVALDKSEITLQEGKKETLKATVLPSDARNRNVTWSSSDESVAVISEKGQLTAIKEGTSVITVTTEEGGFTAICNVTVTPKPAGSGVNIGISSDIHGNISGLRQWLQSVQNDVEPDLDSMLYCGDYSYQMNNLDAFVSEYLSVVEATNEIVGENKGIYTSGNHEYYIGGREVPLDDRFTSVPGFVRIGEALAKDNYIVYCLGAAGWGNNAVGYYPDEDVNALREYLETAPTDIPIFIPAHFPLHYTSGRTITGAQNVIEVLNEHPNTIFLWGHNHTQNDSHYGQILSKGDSISYASGKSLEINFTYACAGGMYQESQTIYSGLVANVNATGDTVTFQYYRTSTGAPVGDPVTIEIEQNSPAEMFSIIASSGEHGSISPSGEVTVRKGQDRTFSFVPDSGYVIDTVTVDGIPVEIEGTSYTFENVTSDHTIQVSFSEVSGGEPTYTWSADNSYVTAEMTLSDGSKETETAETTAVVISEATCEDAGETQYTAVFTNAAFTMQTKTEEDIPALGHDYQIVENSAAEPTCTEEGKEADRICSRCGDINSGAVIPAKGHTEVIDPAIEPTCTESGLTEGRICSVCGEVLQTQEVIPALGHAWSNWITVIDPGCTKTGQEIRICSRCQTVEFMSIPATGHVVVADNGKEPSCTEDGLTEGSHCSVCEEILDAQEEIPALGHTWSEWRVSKEATCTEKGEETRECSVCHETERRDIEAKGHTAATDAGVEPTCTATGLTEGSHCSVCEEMLVAQEEIPALGHTWSKWIKVKDPTCTNAGKEIRMCARCQTLEERNIEATGHTAVTDAGVEPTCTATGLTEGSHCSVCEEMLVAQEEIPALGHTWSKWIKVKDPTCTNAGKEIRMCARCQTLEERNIEATGHTAVTDAGVEPTCTATGLTEGSHCSICGEILVVQKEIPALGHTWSEWRVTKEATSTTKGEETRECSVCHKEERRDIEATGDTDVQKVAMYRLYNPNSGEHFYTSNEGEKNGLVKAGWTYEGIGWYAPKKSNTPVYRLYNKNAGDHHYTMNKKERDWLIGLGWNDEGIGWYSDDSKGVPLYRQYNPNAEAGSHNYTTSKKENDWLVGLGWNEEGIGWYGTK